MVLVLVNDRLTVDGKRWLVTKNRSPLTANPLLTRTKTKDRSPTPVVLVAKASEVPLVA